MRPTARVVAAAALFGAWLGLLLGGYVLGGAVHLLAAAALAVVPWRSLPSDPIDPKESA